MTPHAFSVSKSSNGPDFAAAGIASNVHRAGGRQGRFISSAPLGNFSHNRKTLTAVQTFVDLQNCGNAEKIVFRAMIDFLNNITNTLGHSIVIIL